MLQKSLRLRLNFMIATVVVLLTLAVTITATYAWYVYNTRKSIKSIHLAAGANTNLQISNREDGTYGLSTVMDSYTGRLTPVSTDKISNGFQRVSGFETTGQRTTVASLFEPGESSDYYYTSLYLRTNGSKSKIYLQDIRFEDENAKYPISTAIRVGMVTESGEYIIAVNEAKSNTFRSYNTARGEEGYVLDSRRKDGSVVAFQPKNASNYCGENEETGELLVNANTICIGTVAGNNGQPGKPIRVDVYIWLEGCDPDCVNELMGHTMNNLVLQFAAQPVSG